MFVSRMFVSREVPIYYHSVLKILGKKKKNALLKNLIYGKNKRIDRRNESKKLKSYRLQSYLSANIEQFSLFQSFTYIIKKKNEAVLHRELLKARK